MAASRTDTAPEPVARGRASRVLAMLIGLTMAAGLLPGIVASAPAPPASTGLDAGATDAVDAPALDVVTFEPNRGQVDDRVEFLARAGVGTAFFTPTEVVVAVDAPPTAASDQLGPVVDSVVDRAVARMRFVDADPAPDVVGRERAPGRVNYLLGDDPDDWIQDLPTYTSIEYDGLYDGVDLVYAGSDGNLKSTYHVAPGIDPDAIAWRYDGTQDVRIDAHGNLLVELRSAAGRTVVISEQAPVAWQDIDGTRHPVEVAYDRAADGTVRFAVGAYDPAHTLVIDPELDYPDPELAYSTYLGGPSPTYQMFNPVFQPTGQRPPHLGCHDYSGVGIGTCATWGAIGDERDIRMAVDPDGHTYVTGQTMSAAFPTPEGDRLRSAEGAYRVFVAKMDQEGSALEYTTFLGADQLSEPPNSRNERFPKIAVDADGHAYVSGTTRSDEFPTTDGAAMTAGNAFLVKLTPDGSDLVYATRLGANSAVAVDGSGNAYLTGTAAGGWLPATPGAFQPQPRGDKFSAYVIKLDSTGTEFLYATYLGGSGSEVGSAIAVDALGHAYVTGSTDSDDFPTTAAAFQPSQPGGTDAFVAKLSPGGDALVYATYLGGSGEDHPGDGTAAVSHGNTIAIDSSGHAYVTGTSESGDFPTTPDAFQPDPPMDGNCRRDPDNADDCFSNGFVAKLAASGSSLIYGTHLGAEGWDSGNAVAVDAAGNAVVGGRTTSFEFPTVRAVQPDKASYRCQGESCGVRTDGFVTRLDACGRQALYSTYLAGQYTTIGGYLYSVALDAAGDAYIAGTTDAEDFPTTEGAFQEDHPGGGWYFQTGFVTKIHDEMPGPDADSCSERS